MPTPEQQRAVEDFTSQWPDDYELSDAEWFDYDNFPCPNCGSTVRYNHLGYGAKCVECGEQVPENLDEHFGDDLDAREQRFPEAAKLAQGSGFTLDDFEQVAARDPDSEGVLEAWDEAGDLYYGATISENSWLVTIESDDDTWEDRGSASSLEDAVAQANRAISARLPTYEGGYEDGYQDGKKDAVKVAADPALDEYTYQAMFFFIAPDDDAALAAAEVMSGEHMRAFGNLWAETCEAAGVQANGFEFHALINESAAADRERPGDGELFYL